jgi:hypothetical protein
MPPRWTLAVALLVALVVLGASAWEHEVRATIAGVIGVVFAAVGLYVSASVRHGEGYSRGYEDGRADERGDAQGWGDRRG